MEFFNFWFMLTVAIAGYYILEYKRAEKSGFKNEEEAYNGGLLVPKKEVHIVLGIREKDLKDFLTQYKDRIVLYQFNGQDYYSIENLKYVIKSEINLDN